MLTYPSKDGSPVERRAVFLCAGFPPPTQPLFLFEAGIYPLVSKGAKTPGDDPKRNQGRGVSPCAILVCRWAAAENETPDDKTHGASLKKNRTLSRTENDRSDAALPTPHRAASPPQIRHIFSLFLINSIFFLRYPPHFPFLFVSGQKKTGNITICIV